MVNFVSLKKGSFESAKVSAKRKNLLTNEKIRELAQLSFDEILKYLEEHGFRQSIDSSYLQFEGFYLIERVLNTHISRIYSRIFSAVQLSNKDLFDTFYLKYQIHNFMVLIRSFKSNEKDIEPFLIGDENKKSKFIKAYEMPNKEDSIIYIAKKLKLEVYEFLEIYNSEEIYEIENYLYKLYYEKLNSFFFKYNFLDESKFSAYTKKYVDLINARSFMKLKSENIDKINFTEIYIEGGSINLNFYENLAKNNVKESMKELSKLFDLGEEDMDVSILDKELNEHKKKSKEVFKTIRFGSPFFALRYLFEIETEMNKLRILLKSKYLKLPKEEILKLI